ncbi:MAG TPA: hypothetical protein VEW48_10330 [Thermoanaerobaculia bacterium]|nr:hypothetical protein [Thermoanaerobaculia bacterium]
MRPELLRKWYVYSYNLSRHVLRSPQTTLSLEAASHSSSGADTCLASFQVSGFDQPFRVAMDKVETLRGQGARNSQEEIETWFGEKGSFDFRLDYCLGSGLLIGYVADRSNDLHRDIFIAWKSLRSVALDPIATYSFDNYYLAPLSRSKASEEEHGISIDLGGDFGAPTIVQTYEGNQYTYGILASRAFFDGLKISGVELEPPPGNVPRRIGLWILPVDPADPTGRLLAVGYYFGMLDKPLHGNEVVTDSMTSRPGPECNFSIHAHGKNPEHD